MSNEILINVENISKKFCRDLKRSLWYGMQDIAGELLGYYGRNAQLRPDEFWAVNDISFELKRGECLGLIGRNGAGKSTILKMLNGLIKPDKGHIKIKGRVGALIELGAGFNPILTGRENIYVNGAVLGLTKKEVDANITDIIDFAEIEEFIEMPVQNYSSGMKVRLGFAIATQMEPNVLLIDEILAVGDIPFRMKCYRHILDLKEKGVAIIFVTHNMSDLSRVSDNVLVCSDGGIKLFHDSNLAILEYQKLSNKQITQEKNELVKTNSDNPRISSVKLLDDRLQNKNQFHTGDNIHVDIEINSAVQIKKTRLVVSLNSPLGKLGTVSTPFNKFEFDIKPQTTIIRLKLLKIPLLIGFYHIDITLNGPAPGEFLSMVTQAAYFEILGPPINSFGFGLFGTFYFQHDWTKLSQ